MLQTRKNTTTQLRGSPTRGTCYIVVVEVDFLFFVASQHNLALTVSTECYWVEIYMKIHKPRSFCIRWFKVDKPRKRFVMSSMS